jgi:cytochrome c oxidase subunit I
MTPTQEPEVPVEPEHEEHHTPGTMVLTLVLLASFVVYYFANWKALADVWHVR